MAVRLHYTATRPHGLTADEVAVARGLVTTHNATFPYEAELLTLADPDADALVGTTTLPDQDPFASFLGLAHWCRALTELRRALPGTVWHFDVDGAPVPWDDETGFGWAEQRDPAYLDLMEQLRSDS